MTKIENADNIDNTSGTTAFITGICCLLMSLISPLVSWILGVIAIVFYIKQSKIVTTGTSTAGLVMAIIGIFISIIAFIITLILLLSFL